MSVAQRFEASSRAARRLRNSPNIQSAKADAGSGNLHVRLTDILDFESRAQIREVCRDEGLRFRDLRYRIIWDEVLIGNVHPLSVGGNLKLLEAYSRALAGALPEEHLEDLEALARRAFDPRDNFDIVPVVSDFAVVGGAHVQLPPPPENVSVERRFGALGLWGVDKAAVEVAAATGLEAIEDIAWGARIPLAGIFAHVPTSAASAALMSQVLGELRFVPFYLGKQPPLARGHAPQEVQIFHRPTEEGHPLTRTDAEGYLASYWSTFGGVAAGIGIAGLHWQQTYADFLSWAGRNLPLDTRPEAHN